MQRDGTSAAVEATLAALGLLVAIEVTPDALRLVVVASIFALLF